MAFTSLTERLEILAGKPGYIPKVLAGPILRKVTSQSVTVWLALRSSCNVSLAVSTILGEPAMNGERDTVAVGKNLHIVAVTAQSSKEMVEGVVYQYELRFTFKDSSPPMNLSDATAGATLTYTPPYSNPTFCLSPSDPGLLRLICGSCRKASGDGKDHLPLLDALISQATQSSNPLVRPHQLLLMGDQIYADDVAESLLTMLTDAENALLGWQENIPGGSDGKPFNSKNRPAFTRYQMLKDAEFTSEDMRCHLMSLGEYLSMYLFVWSDVLWPATKEQMPSYAEIFHNVVVAKSNLPDDVFDAITNHLGSDIKGIHDATANLDDLRTSVHAVRRALANIPTYMICDDHEVTDDWNMTRDGFCKGVYGHDLGIRIIQNAVVAYSLCQHWGNTPEQFDPAATPGGELLKLLDGGTSATYDTNSLPQSTPSIRSLVNVHTYQEIMKQTPHPACYHDPVSLDFHYTIEGLGHQVVVTDTRTWRTYEHGGSGAADFLPPSQLQSQILSTPSLRSLKGVDRALLVVLTTNAPPVEFIRAATRHDGIANTFKRFPDVYDSWEMLTLPYDRLIKTLSSKLPASGKQEHYGPIIILSGDVHSSFASRLVYQATVRFEDDQQTPQPTTAVFVQLVASSFKKQTGDTLAIHKEGYSYNPFHATPGHVKEGYIGWNIPDKSPSRKVGTNLIALSHGAGTGYVWASSDTPTFSAAGGIPESVPGLLLHEKPDYTYRLEYLPQSSKAESTSNLSPVSVPTINPVNAAVMINYYKNAMNHLVAYHGDGAGNGEIVGVNNLCEVSFDWGAGDEKFVTQTVRWWYPSSTDVKLLQASYRVKLDPKDFPDITPAVTPWP